MARERRTRKAERTPGRIRSWAESHGAVIVMALTGLLATAFAAVAVVTLVRSLRP